MEEYSGAYYAYIQFRQSFNDISNRYVLGTSMTIILINAIMHFIYAIWNMICGHLSYVFTSSVFFQGRINNVFHKFIQ